MNFPFRLMPQALYMVIMTVIIGCGSNNPAMVDEQLLHDEISRINGLLHDTSFATSMAMGQEESYFSSQGQPAVEFFTGPDSLVKKSLREEKIATSLAGFYALECGIGALMAQKGGSPVSWLKKIADQSIDSADQLLLNRFANATWKAGQPFRSLERISRDNFIVARMLSSEEIRKDAGQVRAAAVKLLDSLKGIDAKELPLETIGMLLRSKAYAAEMASHLEASYYKEEGKEVPPFLSAAEDIAMVAKSARSEKIAINLAGFYALECGLNYLSEVQQKLPSVILRAILADSLPAQDKELLNRFANATWKAGQPFRSLDRITRPVFMPYDVLPEDEKDKDWVQIQSAAKRLLEAMK